MEKGEVAIVGGQFLALTVLVLLLGNYVGGGATTLQIGTAYWGPPSAGVVLHQNTVNSEKTNASEVFIYFTPVKSTTISSISAGRLCLNPTANSTGEERTYNVIPISYDTQKHQNYISFGPTGQPAGIACYYTIAITDSLQQVTSWTGTVNLTS